MGAAVVLTRVSFGLPEPLAATLLIPARAPRLQAKEVKPVALAGV